MEPKMNIADKTIEAINKKQCPICVGLDPTIDKIPKFIVDKQVKEHCNTTKAVAESFKEFSYALLDELHHLVPVVKPNIAFWEMYGPAGVEALIETIKYAKDKGLIVIIDAKRQDIGNTSKAYAQGLIGDVPLPKDSTTNIDADWVTVGAYSGSDTINEFIDVCKSNNKGIIVLVRTSNDSAKEFQDLKSSEKELFKHVAAKVNEWGKDLIGEKGFSAVAAVVGATYPEEAAELRKLMPNTFFLVPGYGAQGGGGKDTIPNFNDEGFGAVVNSSRGIIFAYQKDDKDEKDFAISAKDAIIAMKHDILNAMKEADKLPEGWTVE